VDEWFGELIKKDKEEQRLERKGRIRDSRYNRWYKMIKVEGIPEYLKKGWGESRWRRVLRFKLGNEIGESNYWEEEDKRMCRLCEGETETWEHVWERCRVWRTGGESWQEMAGWILGGGGEGEMVDESDRERKRSRKR